MQFASGISLPSSCNCLQGSHICHRCLDGLCVAGQWQAELLSGAEAESISSLFPLQCLFFLSITKPDSILYVFSSYSSDLSCSTLCSVCSEMLLMLCLVTLKKTQLWNDLMKLGCGEEERPFQTHLTKAGRAHRRQLKQWCCCTPPCTWLEIKSTKTIKVLAVLQDFRKNTQHTLYWAKLKVLVEISEISRFCAVFLACTQWPNIGFFSSISVSINVFRKFDQIFFSHFVVSS